MLRKLISIVVFALLVASLSLNSVRAADKIPTIGVMQLVSQPALDAAKQGLIESLNAAGYVDGKTAKFIFSNAEGDIPTLATIAQSFLDKNADLIVAISTPAAQAAYKATQSLGAPPVVFVVVTSPYAAGIAELACRHPKWVIGTQALAPYALTVPLILKLKPDAKTVGYIYNPAEANSVASFKIVQPLIEKLNLKVEVQTVANSSEIGTAAEALVSKKVDAFYVATDNTVVTGLEALVKVANDNKIPIIGSDPASAKRGAAIAQGLDYVQDGRDAGKISALILAGKLDISKAKINRQQSNLLAVNLDAAAAQGVTVPADLLSAAGVIYKGGENTKAVPTMSATQGAAQDDSFLKALTCTQDELNATPEPTATK